MSPEAYDVASQHWARTSGALSESLGSSWYRPYRIVDLARNLECSACQEAKRHVPRPHATLDPLPPEWNRVQGDNAHWQHPHTGEKIQFTVLVDEGCRFRVGRVMSKTSKGVSGNMLIQFFQEQWKPIFGVPDKIRLDPELF